MSKEKCCWDPAPVISMYMAQSPVEWDRSKTTDSIPFIPTEEAMAQKVEAFLNNTQLLRFIQLLTEMGVQFTVTTQKQTVTSVTNIVTTIVYVGCESFSFTNGAFTHLLVE